MDKTWATEAMLSYGYCPVMDQVGGDAYEDDDTLSQAKVIVVNGSAQHHTFHDAGDQDWVKFYGLSDTIYQVDVKNPEQRCDAVLDLFNAQGQSVLSEPVDFYRYGEAETLSWSCEVDGVYYLMVKNYDATVYGTLTGYDLAVSYPVGAGTGTIVGIVKDASTGQGVSSAVILSDLGGAALSVPGGAYVMVVAEGLQSLTASAEGYVPKTSSEVEVRAGETKNVDLPLTPIPRPLNVYSITTNLSSPPGLRQNITIRFSASGATHPLYYQYWLASGYQTSNYGHWQMLKDWSADNTLIWVPTTNDHYVIVVWATDDTTNPIFHQAGLSIETQGNSADPVQITGLTTNLSYPQPRGRAISLNTTATGGNGPLYYKYWYNKGGTWNVIREYSTMSRWTWTPTEDGLYIVVVWVTDDTSVPEPPIAGMTCTIGD